MLGAESDLQLSTSGGGPAGSLSIATSHGTFSSLGRIQAGGGGSFSLDVAALPTTAALSSLLTEASLTRSQSIRVRTGDVLLDGTAVARNFDLSTDAGAIRVTGQVDASGENGGRISLQASGDLTLADGSLLDASGEAFSHAGKGGAISLETRTGTLDLQAGSQIDLRVAGSSASAPALGLFTGTLHLRAPQLASGTDLQVNPLGSEILGASSICVEGFKVYDLTGASSVIKPAVQASIFANGQTFGGNSAAISSRLLGANPTLASQLSILTGAEIINRTGDLVLGANSNTTSTSDWNLATFRFGDKQAPGVLTLRAAGNLVFNNALSDGFASSNFTSQLLAPNSLLPGNAQSWSYRLTAGADFTATEFQRVTPLAGLASGKGSLLLGKNAGTNSGAAGASTATVIGNRYQVIRTGSGDITISAGRDVQLLNQFATIFTVGTRVADPTLGGTFDVPIPDAPAYAPQYASGGGNVSISAGNDIAHYTRNSAGQLIADSERQLPLNWLYRRGYVDPLTGQFGKSAYGETASTSWWIDYSNFFEGVGALGGGNVTLRAGRDIANVDAVIPTNARMPKGAPDAAALVELGGGDLTVQAGRDLDAGVYYIERGNATVTAGRNIKTNVTRTPSLGIITVPATILPEQTWLPTTFFLGQGKIDISARGNLLLGPVANPFLLPVAEGNTAFYKTYFTTYAPENSVQVSSLAGDVTLRTAATLPTAGAGATTPLLEAWFLRHFLTSTNPQTTSLYQPWLRLAETNVSPFAIAASVLPSTLRLTAFSGSINLVGDLTLAPAPRGTLEIAASGAINGLQRTGVSSVNNLPTVVWGSSTINVSDANPASLPGLATPFANQTIAGTSAGQASLTDPLFFQFFDAFFAETGATSGGAAVLQTKQALHAPGPLHAGDPDPLRLYALDGNLSGVTLFSPKRAQVIAGLDLTDVALYLQNVDAGDVSVISAGRDLAAYNANSPLRLAARAAGNALNFDSPTLAGDLQISGPGTLEVLAGRNLNLGVGPNKGDGTALGLVSIGNARNPSLIFDGASIAAAAGLGSAHTGLAEALPYATFLSSLEETPSSATSAISPPKAPPPPAPRRAAPRNCAASPRNSRRSSRWISSTACCAMPAANFPPRATTTPASKPSTRSFPAPPRETSLSPRAKSKPKAAAPFPCSRPVAKSALASMRVAIRRSIRAS